MIHSQAKQQQPGYGNIETGYGTQGPTPAAYHTLPGSVQSSTQHYASHVLSQQYGSHVPAQQYASHSSPYAHGNKGIKTGVQTMHNHTIREDVQPENVPQSLPPGREELPPPLPPGREEIPPPLPPGREEVPPPLPPGREEVPPPLPPGREEVPPPLPPGRENTPFGREDSSEREEVPPPLPPGRPLESPPHSAPGRVKQQGYGFSISPDELLKAHTNINNDNTGGRTRGHRLDKRDSGNVSGDGTIFHGPRSRHVIKVTSRSAPSSCEGQFGARSNRDEGYPTSCESTPSHSGAATFSITKDHLHFKCVTL